MPNACHSVGAKAKPYLLACH
ncbi:maker588 [Drosophila busckii]|uniref:Maker384 n=1 Tax=Drosophila busckii TaxID=30019 RepID=A0A0M4EDN5_DROBS|nr:maker384 [Drosophila busckii]ALC40132.1 maker588 [Drosophila busckii]